MSTKTKPATNIVDAMLTHVAKIGFSNGMQFDEARYEAPKDLNNEQAEALFWRMRQLHELALTQKLRSYADKRYESAKAICLEAGLLGDFDNLATDKMHRTTHLPNGIIDVKVNADGETVDPTVLMTELRLLGVSKDKIDKALAKATKLRRGARVITVTLT